MLGGCSNCRTRLNPRNERTRRFRVAPTLGGVPSVRLARLDDADALAGLHVRTWQAAYRGILSDTFLDGLSVVERLDWWTGRLTRIPSRWAVEVVEHEAEVAGFVSTGTTDDRDEPHWGELYALYVEPSLWGRGLGTALLEGAERTLLRNRFSDALLWVLRGNERARGFYETAGWVADGAAKRMIIGAEGVTAVRYGKRLGPRPDSCR